jgi:hypothetical protein
MIVASTWIYALIRTKARTPAEGVVEIEQFFQKGETWKPYDRKDSERNREGSGLVFLPVAAASPEQPIPKEGFYAPVAAKAGHCESKLSGFFHGTPSHLKPPFAEKAAEHGDVQRTIPERAPNFA